MTAESGTGDADAGETRPAEPTGTNTPEDVESDEESLGWRGWVVVAALVVSMLVVPWTIILLPAAGGTLGSLGLGWRDAYLVLPLLPALALGSLAVWAAVAGRR